MEKRAAYVKALVANTWRLISCDRVALEMSVLPIADIRRAMECAPIGFGGPTGLATCDPPLRPADRTIGRDDPTCAETKFSRSLKFRVFQHYRREADLSRPRPWTLQSGESRQGSIFPRILESTFQPALRIATRTWQVGGNWASLIDAASARSRRGLEKPLRQFATASRFRSRRDPNS